MKIIAVTQARIGSSRLPGKVLKTIDGVSLLHIHLSRLLESERINKIMVATTEEPDAVAICRIAEQLGIESYCGSTNDVLDRYYQTVNNLHPDFVVRITSDCPLIDPRLIDEIVEFAVAHDFDYVSNTLIPTYPDGLDVEVFKFKALEKAWYNATLLSDREHVTPYIWRNSTLKGGELFTSANVSGDENYDYLRLTVDEAADFQLITQLVHTLGVKASWKAYVSHLIAHPQLQELNRHIIHNEGYLNSLKKDIR